MLHGGREIQKIIRSKKCVCDTVVGGGGGERTSEDVSRHLPIVNINATGR